MEKDKDIIEIIVDDDINSSDEGAATGYSSLRNVKNISSSFFKELSPLFVRLSCCGALLVMLLALFLGIYVPKSTASVEKQLSSLRASDKTYIEKKSEYDALVSEEEQLSSHIEQTNDELEKFEKTQDNLDKLSQKNIQLQSEKEQLQNEIASKQSKLSSLESSVNAYSRSSVTWSSGKYTVGTNIAAGTYIITGTGSIAISNSGTARVNKSLKSDGEVFTLNDGDIIKIDGNAKLVSE